MMSILSFSCISVRTFSSISIKNALDASSLPVFFHAQSTVEVISGRNTVHYVISRSVIHSYDARHVTFEENLEEKMKWKVPGRQE